MLKHIILLIALAPLGFTTNGQERAGKFTCGIVPHKYGDSTQAIRARHHTEDTVTQLRVQLGYIDSDSATVKEVNDNLEVGLRVVRFPNYKVVSYRMGFLPKGGDYRPPWEVIKGNKISQKQIDNMHIWVRPGDLLGFSDIVVNKDGATYPLKMKNVDVRVK